MHYVGQAVATAFWFFVFWYGSWALLWLYQQISMRPHAGWWNWALPLAAIFAELERLSVDLEAREAVARAPGFWEPYLRQAAIGTVFGLGLLVIGISAELLQWPPDLLEAQLLGLMAAVCGAFTLVVITAGRRRDYPVLSAIHDLAAGAIAGAAVSWLALSMRSNAQADAIAWTGVGAGLCGGLNLWRRSAWGGGFASRLTNMVARSKTIIIGIWWAVAGGLMLRLIWNSPVESYTSGVARTVILFLGSGVSLYLLFARGLGTIANALSLLQPTTDIGGREHAATASDVRQAGLLPRAADAIYLGRFLDNGRERDEVGYPGSAHLVTIGPAGSGKRTGLIVPNLSALRRSILVIDPKGETAAITAHKRAQFGPVIVINPFNVLADQLPHLKSSRFNPLAALDPGHDDFADDCNGIGQALVREGRGEGAIVSGSAQDLITALIMHEKFERREQASLANVRTMLTEPFTSTAESGPTGLLKTVIKMTTSNCAALRSKTGRFLRDPRTSDKDFISAAIKETRFLDSPQIQRDLQGPGIDWDKLKHEVATVYVILPADRLDTHANYLRLVVSSALRALLRSPPDKTLPPVLFMLDDFATLGYLPPIESAMGIVDGLGVQLWPFLQDVNQLRALYQDSWQTFLGNAAALTAFGPRDVFTAQYLSGRTGKKVAIVDADVGGAGESGATNEHDPQAASPFKPAQSLTMPKRQMLSFVEPAKNPFMSKAPGYWDMPFNEGLDASPYRQG